MNLVLYAVPFFIVAIVFELAFGVIRKRNTFRLNDSISSLFLGVLSQARRFVTLGVGGYVYYLITQYFSLPLLDSSSVLTWIVAFVLYDFCYYWLHRMGHERTILWAAHVAHHQSEDYNLTTALRQTSTGFLLGWIFYIPMYLLGIPAEVVVTVGSINLIYQFWVHTEHVPKLGWYEWIFVTPSNHRVHHAQNDLYVDRNYGGVFILWDRLFGTFQEEQDDEPCIYGIRGPLRSWNPVTALTHVYLSMIRDSWHTQRWTDKLRVWVSRTGWRPQDVQLAYPHAKPDLSVFSKFDPDVSRKVAWYAFFQLLAVIALLNIAQTLDLSYAVGVTVWAVLLTTMVTTAIWLNGDAYANALRWDSARWIALLVLVIAWVTASPINWLSISTSLYLVVNGLFLLLLGLSGKVSRGSVEMA